MPEKLSLALAQLNPVLGDITGNLARLRKARAEAGDAQLLLTSELFLSGYPPEDLVLKASFLAALRHAVEELAKDTEDGGPAVLLGTPWPQGGRPVNAVLLLDGGAIKATVLKRDLPNYGVFDEKRVFMPGPLPLPVEFRGRKLGVLVCEDMWTADAAAHLKKNGAEILLVPNGSPYESDKQGQRMKLARARVQETGLPLVYVNQVGGQDELVFDGASFVLDHRGEHVAQMKAWEEDLLLTHWLPEGGTLRPEKSVIEETPQGEAAIYHALMLGLRDYVDKNGFPGAVLGLSGGIDSALAAVLAADALGPERTWTAMLPSPYTSRESLDDAQALAKNLRCRHDSIHITAAMDAFATVLDPVFAGRKADTAEENIQSRCRGLILMALSNKFGPMVVSTGNKSEMSVGYATLYGDMCGGFAVLKDLYKTQLYKVARWRNANRPQGALGPKGPVIPENIFVRPPTAELRPDQKDTDSLPPYDVLDDILECLVEKDMGAQDICARGHDAALVERVWTMLDRAEYKRRQAPPGVKITRRSFGRDRRYPIVNRYRET